MVGVAILLSVSAFAIVFAPYMTRAQSAPPPVSPDPTLSECPGGTDLSTGTNGSGTANPVSTSGANSYEGSWYFARYVPAYGSGTNSYPVGSTVYLVTAGSLDPAASPAGRFNWIAPDPLPTARDVTPRGTYEYTVTFTATGEGTFYLYKFGANNNMTLSLKDLTTAQTTGGPWSTGDPGWKAWWPTSGQLPGLALKGGLYELDAIVKNAASSGPYGSSTGFAVYAVYCPAWPWSTPSWAYDAKFVCNTATPSAAPNIGLEPGLYDTDINILNPSFSNTTVHLVEKFVVAMPQSTSLGPPQASQVVSAVPNPYVIRWVTLKPDASVRIDCRQILSYLSLSLPHQAICGVSNPTVSAKMSTCKGFVEIYTNNATDPYGYGLNVWAEYSAAGSSTVGVSSLQLVQVQSVPYTP